MTAHKVLPVLALIWGAAVSGHQEKTRLNELGSTDTAVINAVLTSFYKQSNWRHEEWSKGDFVVVRPQWASNTRPSFETVLDNLIVSAFFRHGAETELTQLEDIKHSIQSEGDPFDPGEVLRIGDLKLVDKIVVSTISRDITVPREEVIVENRAGRRGTIRADASLYPPAYSRDGRYVFLYLTGLPSGLHTENLSFILERTAKSWNVVYVRSHHVL